MTQNIDNLEEKAGFKLDQICQAHGANFGAVCSVCKAQQDRETLVKGIRAETVVRCNKDGCEGPVKPEIVFFGEDLPDNFSEACEIASGADLLIVIGTALAVSPFNSIVEMI